MSNISSGDILSWRLARGASALGASCSVCGATQNVEILLVKRVADIEAKDAVSSYIRSMNIPLVFYPPTNLINYLKG